MADAVEDVPLVIAEQTLIMGKPPCCLEFWPVDPEYFVIGTYNLLGKENGVPVNPEDSDAPSDSVEDSSRASMATAHTTFSTPNESSSGEPRQQRRDGSLVLLRVNGNSMEELECTHTASAVLDIHFSPHDPTVLAAATSNGTVVLYSIENHPGPNPRAGTHISHPVVISLFDDETIVTSLAWDPGNENRMAVTTSTGDVVLVTLSPSFYDLQSNRKKLYDYLSGSKLPPTEVDLQIVHHHSLEGWITSFSQSLGNLDTAHTGLFSGGDDGALQFSPIPGTTPVLTGVGIGGLIKGQPESSAGTRASTDSGKGDVTAMPWIDKRAHSAGVTAILPMTVEVELPQGLSGQSGLERSQVSTGASDVLAVLVTGCYDDRLRIISCPLFSKRNSMTRHSPSENPSSMSTPRYSGHSNENEYDYDSGSKHINDDSESKYFGTAMSQKPQVLHELPMPGGVWRIKVLSTDTSTFALYGEGQHSSQSGLDDFGNRVSTQARQERGPGRAHHSRQRSSVHENPPSKIHKVQITIMMAVACMYAGAYVVEVKLDTVFTLHATPAAPATTSPSAGTQPPSPKHNTDTSPPSSPSRHANAATPMPSLRNSITERRRSTSITQRWSLPSREQIPDNEDFEGHRKSIDGILSTSPPFPSGTPSSPTSMSHRTSAIPSSTTGDGRRSSSLTRSGSPSPRRKPLPAGSPVSTIPPVPPLPRLSDPLTQHPVDMADLPASPSLPIPTATEFPLHADPQSQTGVTKTSSHAGQRRGGLRITSVSRTWASRIVARMPVHESICYGLDVQPLPRLSNARPASQVVNSRNMDVELQVNDPTSPALPHHPANADHSYNRKERGLSSHEMVTGTTKSPGKMHGHDSSLYSRGAADPGLADAEVSPIGTAEPSTRNSTGTNLTTISTVSGVSGVSAVQSAASLPNQRSNLNGTAAATAHTRMPASEAGDARSGLAARGTEYEPAPAFAGNLMDTISHALAVEEARQAQDDNARAAAVDPFSHARSRSVTARKSIGADNGLGLASSTQKHGPGSGDGQGQDWADHSREPEGGSFGGEFADFSDEGDGTPRHRHRHRSAHRQSSASRSRRRRSSSAVKRKRVRRRILSCSFYDKRVCLWRY